MPISSHTCSAANSASSTPYARGQGLLEFALILPLLLLVIIGVIEGGRMLAIYSSLSSAAQQAARYGAVAGDSDSGLPFYLDCEGMRATALRTSILVGLKAEDVSISYDRGQIDASIGSCPVGAVSPTISETIRDGYRVVISITAVYHPIVPIVPLPDLPIVYAAARTIFTTIIGPTATPPPNPDVYIAKRGVPGVVQPNGTLTYWITATNNVTSAVIATDITISDTLPVSVTLTQDDLDAIHDDYNWSCTFLVASAPQTIECTRLAPLAVGQSSGFSYEVQTPLLGNVTLTNTVLVSSEQTDLQPSNNTAIAVNQVLAGADLQPYKVISPTGDIGGGTVLTYTLWVFNNGGSTSETKASSGNYIWITDTLPSGVLPYQSLTVPSGWVCLTLTLPDRLACRYQNNLDSNAATPAITLVITAPTTAGPMVNSAYVTPSGLTTDPILTNNTVSVTAQIVTNADISITKIGSTTASGEGSLTYTLRASNAGPSVAANVRLTDTLPGPATSVTAGTGWTCESPVVANTLKCVRTTPLAVGATTSDITVVITVPNSDIVNTATVGSDMPDPDLSNNSASVATTVTVCHVGRVYAPYSTVNASPTAVQANGTAVAQITVDLRDLCANAATDSQTVTLTSSRGLSDTITVASGSSNPTTNGRIVFEVRSTWPGTSTYSVSAQNNTQPETVNLTATADVTFYSCLSVTGQKNQISTQTYVDFRLTNSTDRAWKLTNISIDWPQTSGRRIQSVVMGTSPQTTLWSGNNNNDPFSLPGSAAWDANTDTARTVGVGVAGQSLLFNFSFATPGQAYVLTATWDDNNGRTCTTTTTVTP